jgi:hypothetical protein
MSDIRGEVEKYFAERQNVQGRLHKSFGEQARNYNFAYFVFLLISVTILVVLLWYNIHHLLEPVNVEPVSKNPKELALTKDNRQQILMK